MSIEILQYMVFNHACSAKDVLSLALTSRNMYRKLLGEVGEENKLDVLQHRGMAGLGFCLRKGWWKAALIAIERGFGGRNEEMRRGGVPLTWASWSGQTEVVEALLKCPEVDPLASNCAAMRYALESGSTEVVRLLLSDERVDPRASFNQIFNWACQFGNGESVDILLEDERIEPRASNNLGLRLACEAGNPAAVNALLRDGRVNSASFTPAQVLNRGRTSSHFSVTRVIVRWQTIAEIRSAIADRNARNARNARKLQLQLQQSSDQSCQQEDEEHQQQ